MTQPDRDGHGRRGRTRALLLVAIFVVGAGHAALYAVSFPPWAIEDEQQHVDYTWRIAFEHRVPHIREPIDDSIVQSVMGTERWKSYEMGPPAGPTAEQLGLQARSYTSYHPPLYYMATAPVAWVVGDRALVLMYALRGLTALLAGLVCVLGGLLAARWAPGGSVRLATGVAGFTLAGMPALADSGGRHNTDLAAAAVVLGMALAADSWTRRPDARRACVVAALAGAAIVTRETALVAIVPLVAAAVVLHRRQRLAWAQVVAITGTAGAAALMTAAVVRASTGSWDGSGAFLTRYGVPFPDLGAADLVRALARHALLPYGQWSGSITAVVVGTSLALVLWGGHLAYRSRCTGPTLVAWGALAAQLVILLLATRRGLNIPTARLLLPSYPLLVAWLAVGFSTLHHRLLAYAPAALSMTVGAAFFLHDLAPRYPFRLG